MPADILIYAFVAVGLVFWLRNVLGSRNGSERQRPNPFGPGAAAPQAGAAGRPARAALAAPDVTLPAAGLERHMAVTGGAAVEEALTDLARLDRSFELLRFMRGAQDAFVMIVEAFAAGDRETLRSLLNDSVYNAFCGALDARAAKGEQSSVEIHAVRRNELTAAKIEGRVAFLTVRFTADETNVLRAADGTILHGHPDRVTEIVDIWTFTRDTRSRDPSWLVSETREEMPPVS